MEALLALLVVGIVVGVPVAGLIVLLKLVGLGREMRTVRQELEQLERRVSALAAREAAPPVGSTTLRSSEPTVRVTPQASQIAVVAPAIAPPSEPLVPRAPVTAPAEPRRPPLPATAPMSASEQADVQPAALPIETPPPRPSTPEAPPRPEPPGPPPASPPPGPGFDWESLLGVRGAAWVGGVAVFVSAILFAKFAIDRDLITPELRIALMLLAGVSALGGAEWSLRRGYATTANAVSGAGIAILYAAFFAAHSLYGLLGMGATFALMALVTVVACVLAIHYDAYFTAVLGLIGGFVTPLALSTGEDRPLGLFSYILLLNVGLASVALRKKWHGLVLLACACTFVIEYGWFARHLTPQKTLIGLIAFLLFGLLFLLLPVVRRDSTGAESASLVRAGAAGGLAPFLFAVLIAGDARFASEWPLLFAFVGLLLAALGAIALARGRVALLIAGALASAITLPLWASQGLRAQNALAATAGAAVLCLLANLPRRVAGLLSLEEEPRLRNAFEGAGLIAGVGLGLYGFVLVAKNPASSPWPFFVLAAGLLVILLERSREGAIRLAAPFGALAIGVLIQFWFLFTTQDETLVRNLSLPLLFAVILSAAVGRRRRRHGADAFQEAAVVLASGCVLLGLFGCMALRPLASDPRPLLAGLAVAVVLLLVSSLRASWGSLSLGAEVASALFLGLWQERFLRGDDVPLLLSSGALFYLTFLALPFVVGDAIAPGWKRSAWPWVASALAGPVFFWPLHDAVVRGWGKGFIGMLPVAMAAAMLPALRGVAGRFPPATGAAERDRLRYLALFAAVALGLIAVAIPLQLDKQWITVGWALEAMAVSWLFRHLPHPGLRVFAAVLFGMVGARLLLNPEVLGYHERGWPIVNWLLYTYGLSALSALVAARWLHLAERSEPAQAAGIQPTRAPAAFALLGLLLIFALVNLEIADFFSTGPVLKLTGGGYAQDLTTSMAWGVYAMALLVVGVWRGVPELRYLSLAFLLLTIGKVFLYDLSNVGGLYRILSFLGLGVSLILVSLFYQRFVFRKQVAA